MKTTSTTDTYYKIRNSILKNILKNIILFIFYFLLPYFISCMNHVTIFFGFTCETKFTLERHYTFLGLLDE